MEYLHRERDEIRQKIMEMEEKGHTDPDEYRKVEEIDCYISKVESKLR